jgi:hypothetical protein
MPEILRHLLRYSILNVSAHNCNTPTPICGTFVVQASLAELLMPEILRHLLLHASHHDTLLPVVLSEHLVRGIGHNFPSFCPR